jgi:hypothetical protein
LIPPLLRFWLRTLLNSKAITINRGQAKVCPLF